MKLFIISTSFSFLKACSGVLKMQNQKMQDLKMWDQMSGGEMENLKMQEL